MSQKTELRINALESRVAALEGRLQELESPKTAWSAVHHGFGRWRAEGPDGTPMGTEWLSKEDAQAQADDMNAALEGAEVA